LLHRRFAEYIGRRHMQPWQLLVDGVVNFVGMHNRRLRLEGKEVKPKR